MSLAGKNKKIKNKSQIKTEGDGAENILSVNRINTLLTKMYKESYRKSGFLGFSVAYTVTIT